MVYIVPVCAMMIVGLYRKAVPDKDFWRAKRTVKDKDKVRCVIFYIIL